MQITRLLASAILLVACTPKAADTDGEASSSSVETDGAGATSVTATAPTTGTDSTTSQTASSAPDDTGTATSAGTSTDTSVTTSPTSASEATTTTGGGEQTLPEACAAACALWEMCSPGSVGPVEQCVWGCTQDVEGSPGCVEALAAQWSCVAGLSCAEAVKFLDEGVPTSCVEEVGAADEACVELGCNGEIGGDMETCELEQECQGTEQRYVCDTDNCTCFEDGTPGPVCPSNGFCASGFDEQRAAITACCGWTWEI